MPTFDYVCPCGWQDTMLVKSAEEAVTCLACGNAAVRSFSPTTALRLAPWMTREAEDSRARHRHWLGKPDTQKRIKSGELAPDMSDRYCENLDGAQGSSSIITRSEEGLPF